MNLYQHYTSSREMGVGFLTHSLGFKSTGLKKDGEIDYINKCLLKSIIC